MLPRAAPSAPPQGDTAPVAATVQRARLPAGQQALSLALALAAVALASIFFLGGPPVAIAAGAILAGAGLVLGFQGRGLAAPDRRAAEAAEQRADERWRLVAADAEAASAAKSRFLAMVSHELRTPLGGILGMAGLLRRSGVTAEQASYVRAIETSGGALLVLIDDLLDVVRIESGRIDLLPVAADLAEEVESLVELLAPRAAAKGIELAAFVDPGLPRRLVADVARLRQVLFNLIGNGIKFTAEGGVAVEVAVVDAPDGRAGVRFEVRDTGIGIHPADMERIFEEFEQADPGLAREHGGAGLGLAIARRLVALMGGTLGLQSAPGAGSSFGFTVELPPAEGRATEGGARTARLAGHRIAVVSHGLVEAPLIVRRLGLEGAEARLLFAAELEESLAAWHADAVIVDAALGDPVAVLERVRAVSAAPAALLLPVAARAELALYRAAGYAAHVPSPARAASLLRALDVLLGRGSFEEAQDTPPLPAPAPGRLRILICDDNEINVLLGRSLLESLGHEVVTADGGRTALLRATEAEDAGRPFDVVLMDLHMPEMDGFEAARRLRAAPGGDRLRLVALTADRLPETRARGGAEPFDLWIAKPLDPDAVAGALLPAEPRAAASGAGATL